MSLIPNSAIRSVARYSEGASAPAGTAMMVSFVLDGIEFQALNGGRAFTFTEAISLSARAETQDEIDRLWNGLTREGGEPGRCGWLKDKYGLSWQIVPPALGELLGGADAATSARVMRAMLGMGKIDIAELRAAYDAT